MGKRIAFFMSAVILATLLLAVSVFGVDVVESGKCGTNVTWTLYSDGMLIVSGSGEMYNYSTYNINRQSPLYGKEQIKEVVVQPGVTQIGDASFYECHNISRVTLNEGLTYIGTSAFENCTSLQSVSIPDSLYSIGEGLFAGCTSLKEIVVSPNNPRFASVSGVLFDKEITTLVQCPGAKAGQYNIPDTVWRICGAAFCGCNLNSVNIPNSVTQIGTSAFAHCDSLQEITIPGSVKEVGRGICGWCKHLKSAELKPGIEAVAESMFFNCERLESVVLPEGITEIGDSAFSMTNIETITLPDSVETVGKEAFAFCYNLSSASFSTHVKSVGAKCFWICKSLEQVSFMNRNTLIGEDSFFMCDSLENILYAGSESDWKTTGNYYSSDFDEYKNLKMHYNVTDFDNHFYSVHVDPKCEEWGYDQLYCTCGYDYPKTDYTQPLKHDWGAWQITIPATDTTPGKEICVCKNDPSHIQTREIPPKSAVFTDIDNSAFYYTPVLWAVSHTPQITNGTSASTFSPDATCTRGQVVTFLWRAKGCPEPTSANNPFKDVFSSDYYYKAVLWANEQGITNGTSASAFSPNSPCTRAHVVTFLWRAEGKPSAGGTNPFKDVASGQYYTDAVLWAVSKNITNGTSATTFSPGSPCTRGQIVTFLYRDMKE